MRTIKESEWTMAVKTVKTKEEQEHFYTVKETALRVGVSPDTIIRWRKLGLYKPSYKKTMGQLTVYLYDDSDVEKMRVVAAHTKPGPKPKKKGKKSA